LKTIYDLLELWVLEGKGYFDGNDMTALPGAEMVRRGIASMPQIGSKEKNIKRTIQK